MLGIPLIALITVLAAPDAVARDASDGHAVTDAADIPLAAAAGGPRRWQVESDGGLGLHGAPSPDSRVVSTVDDGAVLSNLGCEALARRVWCQVETLRGRVRGHVPAERLRPAVGPDGTVPVGVDDSARRVREGDVDARAAIPCAQERGQSMGKCTVRVTRGTGGDATAVARFPNGFERTLHFRHGEFVSANATMSGSGSDTDWRRTGGRHLIRVDDQRYELPDELVFGR